jgi:hypothetical protein
MCGQVEATPTQSWRCCCSRCGHQLCAGPPAAWPARLPCCPQRQLRVRPQQQQTHHSCSRTVRSSRYIVLLRKSMPIVACVGPSTAQPSPAQHSTVPPAACMRFGQRQHQQRGTHLLSHSRLHADTDAAVSSPAAPAKPPHDHTPTWYVLSNLSYMNRVMMLVLPTDWSPRKTCACVCIRVQGSVSARRCWQARAMAAVFCVCVCGGGGCMDCGGSPPGQHTPR